MRKNSNKELKKLSNDRKAYSAAAKPIKRFMTKSRRKIIRDIIQNNNIQHIIMTFANNNKIKAYTIKVLNLFYYHTYFQIYDNSLFRHNLFDGQNIIILAYTKPIL